MSTALDIPAESGHLVLTNVSWSYYEKTLEEIGNRPIRVSFLDGNIEIMSPLPEHEAAKRAIGSLIETMSLELKIRRKSFGSTTFRREEKSAGTEPDECYYFQNFHRVKGMKRFDPLIHPAPDLAIEVDILSPSFPREPIYSRLGVPEIWRYNGERLVVRLLTGEGVYEDSPTSRAFPFLPIAEFARFIQPLIEEEETEVLSTFRDWVRALPR